MLAKVEQGQTWLEHITYQMTLLPYAEQSRLLAGPMALLKAFLSKSQGEIVSVHGRSVHLRHSDGADCEISCFGQVDEAVQIWGGRALTKGGMGVYIE